MKKRFCILICIIITFSLVSCGKTQESNTTSSDVSKVSVSSSEVSSTTSDTPSSEASASSKSTASTKAPVLSSFTESNITFKLPNTFIKISESPIMYVHSSYPQIADNFNIAIGAKDPNFNQLTKEAYKQQLESMYSSFDMTEFKSTTISGYPAIKISYSLSYNDVSMEMIQYVVNGDKTYSFTYTFVNGDLKDYANECGASITIKK